MLALPMTMVRQLRHYHHYDIIVVTIMLGHFSGFHRYAALHAPCVVLVLDDCAVTATATVR